MNRIGETLGGKFTLTELLGRSELGNCFKGMTPNGRLVALKVLHPDINPKTARALLANAKELSQLKTPRIARILGAKLSKSDATYVVSEWVDGTNLADLVLESGGLHPSQAAHYLIQACSALAILHDKNMPHCNLKPSNIFVSGLASSATAMIVDAMGSGVLGLSPTGELLGNVKHMSPEQLRSVDVNWQSDIFNLGVIAYFLVSAKYPFAAPTPNQTAQRIQTNQYRELKEIIQNLDPLYEKFVTKCLQTNPSLRFSSLREAAQQLAEIKGQHSDASLDVQETKRTTREDDATMAFSVPDELQAFFDEHVGEESIAEAPKAKSTEMDQASAQSAPSESSLLEAPFFMEEEADIAEDEHTVQVTGGYNVLDLSIGPDQVLDDDLPFHSVSVSQSVLDQEASLIQELDKGSEVQASFSEPPNMPQIPTPATSVEEGPSLEADDIMAALRSTMEAVGPIDLDVNSVGEAPVVAVSDFEALATNEFERKASNENRFLSTKAQTGLKRPVFALFLLVLLALAAGLFQYEFNLEEEQEHKRLQRMRFEKIQRLQKARAHEKKKTDPLSSASPLKNTPEKTTPAAKKPDGKETNKAERPSSSLAQPTETKKRAGSIQSKSGSNKTPRRSSPKKTSSKQTQKTQKTQKAPKVELVDPFTAP